MGASSFIRRCLVGDIASNVRNQIRSRRSRRMLPGGSLQVGRRSYPASAFLGTLAVALTGVHRCVPWQPPSSRRRLGKSASAGKPCYSGFPQFDFLYDTFTLDLRKGLPARLTSSPISDVSAVVASFSAVARRKALRRRHITATSD